MGKPKVISLFKLDKFENRFLNVQMIGKPVDFFVECKSYDMEIPVNSKRKKELDIFEETILRMVNIKKCSPAELADVLCLKKDLVNFILIRLKESGILEDNQTLSERGKEILDLQENIRSEVKYIQGKLFVIKKTGLILPYIHVGEFQSESVDEFNPSSITLGYGSAGKYKRVYGRCLRNSDYEKRADSRIDTRVLKRTIKSFNKIALAQNKEIIDLNEEYGISSSSGDNIYFHLQAVIQEGNIDEVMFSDGFVSNIDGMLNYVNTENYELLKDIKARAVDMVIGTNNEGEKKEYIPQKYKEIHKLYHNACSHMSTKSYDGATIDEKKDIDEDKRQIVIDCYYMLEWAFYYYTIKNRISEQMMNLFKSKSVASNAETLISIATSIGIEELVVRKSQNLFWHLDSGKIYSVYNYQSPQLYVSLPLAIVEAKENCDSKIHTLIQRDGSFLEFINLLNSHCGNLRHDSDSDAIDMNATEVLNETLRIISILLPDIAFDGVGIGKMISHVSEARLLAQVYLEKVLGSIYFTSMSKGLQSEWIKISPDKKLDQLPEPYEYVMIISRILEAELLDANREFGDGKKMSQDKALEIITKRYGGNIPKSFSMVGNRNYEKAIRNQKASLGASALVYFANEDKTRIEKLNEANFISVLDRIISLRGHGTTVVLNEDVKSLNILRDEVIKLSRIIGGFYD